MDNTLGILAGAVVGVVVLLVMFEYRIRKPGGYSLSQAARTGQTELVNDELSTFCLGTEPQVAKTGRPWIGPLVIL